MKTFTFILLSLVLLSSSLVYSTTPEQDFFNQTKASAETGNPLAQYHLAMLHLKGLGTKRDRNEYVRWLNASAFQGYAPAQVRLAFTYRRGDLKDPDKGFKWAKEAALQGHAPGQNVLGLYYNYGLGVKKDIKQAIHWYTLAASQGFRASFGNLYYLVRKEGNLLAFNALKQLAKAGHAEASYLVGLCYVNGFVGVKKDIKQARYWLELSVNQGHLNAEKQLKRLKANQ